MSDPTPLTEQPDIIRDAVRVLGPTGTLAEAIVQSAALAHAATLDAARSMDVEALRVMLCRERETFDLMGCRHPNQHRAHWDCMRRANVILDALMGRAS